LLRVSLTKNSQSLIAFFYIPYIEKCCAFLLICRYFSSPLCRDVRRHYFTPKWISPIKKTLNHPNLVNKKRDQNIFRGYGMKNLKAFRKDNGARISYHQHKKQHLSLCAAWGLRLFQAAPLTVCACSFKNGKLIMR
jgi:hypothetical protein